MSLQKLLILKVGIERVEHQMSDFEFIVMEKIVNESEDHIVSKSVYFVTVTSSHV